MATTGYYFIIHRGYHYDEQPTFPGIITTDKAYF